MSIKDLKFPPLYEIEWANNLPKPNCSYIYDNHVRSAFSYIEVGHINEYPANLQQIYAESKQPGEGFATWFWHHTGCLDSFEFDKNGNLVKYGRNCLMCGTINYKYDSLGFIVYHNAGSDAIIDYYYHYFFDPGTQMLYYCDTGTHFSSDLNVDRLHFDSLGYLRSFEYKNISFGCISITNYTYNQYLQINTVERRDSIIPGSEHSKEVWPITIGSLSTYYYSGKYPDSIITNYFVNLQQGVHPIQKIYLDSAGLPFKSVYINFPNHRKLTDVRRYRYHGW